MAKSKTSTLTPEDVRLRAEKAHSAFSEAADGYAVADKALDEIDDAFNLTTAPAFPRLGPAVWGAATEVLKAMLEDAMHPADLRDMTADLLDLIGLAMAERPSDG